jgi:fibronectin type 3 domain-containing protein
VNARGESARSLETSARPAGLPGVPRNVSAKSRPAGGVNLSWLAPTSNGGTSITGYMIYRATSAGAEVFLASIAGTGYVDTATSKGVRYFYVVSAVNAIGEGVKSTETSAVAK